MPIYATGGTLDQICEKDKKNVIKRENLFQLYADQPVGMGDMQIMPYKMSHDAADPVCYTVEADGQKVSMATDLGVYDDYIVDHLEDSDVLLIEANHDIICPMRTPDGCYAV